MHKPRNLPSETAVQAQMSRRFLLLVTQATNRVALYPFDQQDIRCHVWILSWMSSQAKKRCLPSAFALQICCLLKVQKLPTNYSGFLQGAGNDYILVHGISMCCNDGVLSPNKKHVM